MQHVSPSQAAVAETAAPARPRVRGRVSKFPDVIFGVADVDRAVRRVARLRAMLVGDARVLAAGWVQRTLPHLADVRVRRRHASTSSALAALDRERAPPEGLSLRRPPNTPDKHQLQEKRTWQKTEAWRT